MDLDYFKIKSLPFFKFQQTNLETTSAYYNWIIEKVKLSNNILITKIEESKESEYIILKIAVSNAEFYRLLTRRGNVFFSIKIFDKNSPAEDMLNKLRTVYKLNKQMAAYNKSLATMPADE